MIYTLILHPQGYFRFFAPADDSPDQLARRAEHLTKNRLSTLVCKLRYCQIGPILDDQQTPILTHPLTDKKFKLGHTLDQKAPRTLLPQKTPDFQIYDTLIPVLVQIRGTESLTFSAPDNIGADALETLAYQALTAQFGTLMTNRNPKQYQRIALKTSKTHDLIYQWSNVNTGDTLYD